MGAQGGATSRAMWRYLMALINLAVAPQRLYRPPARFNIVIVQSYVRMLHIQPAADAPGELLPFLDVFKDAFPTKLVKLSYTILLDFSFPAKTKGTLHLELYRQSMGVPPCLARYMIAFHCLVPADNILEQTREHMMNTRTAIGRRRTFIEGIMLSSSPCFNAFVKDTILLPKTKDKLFDLGEICLATHFLKQELAPSEQDNHLSGLTLTDAMGSDIRVICQSQVNDAAFVRQHWLQRNSTASQFHLVCQIQR